MAIDPDARELARLGYTRQLARRLGAFSSFAIGFSVISVLTGVTSAFGDAPPPREPGEGERAPN